MNLLTMTDDEMGACVDERAQKLIKEATDEHAQLCAKEEKAVPRHLADLGFLFRKVAGLQIAVEYLAELAEALMEGTETATEDVG